MTNICVVGWVAEMGGRVVGCAHPLEKSAPGFEVQAYIAYLVGGEVSGGGEVASGWVLSRGNDFFSNRYDSGMDIGKSKELWDRLDNESERAHRAFQTFLNLPSHNRTIVEAYRDHVGNPEATKPSDTWVRWSRDFAWTERASAYDDHIETMIVSVKGEHSALSRLFRYSAVVGGE